MERKEYRHIARLFQHISVHVSQSFVVCDRRFRRKQYKTVSIQKHTYSAIFAVSMPHVMHTASSTEPAVGMVVSESNEETTLLARRRKPRL